MKARPMPFPPLRPAACARKRLHRRYCCGNGLLPPCPRNQRGAWFHRLLVGVREDEADAVLAAVPVEVLQRVHARRIERWHASHADDQVLREGFHRYVGYAVGHAEEHGSVDLVHAHAFREFAQVRDLGILVAVVFPAANLGLLAHHLHEQDDRDQHAHGNRHHQVEHDGQREGE